MSRPFPVARNPRCSPRARRVTQRTQKIARDAYYDLNIRHFHEKLREEHDIDLSYTWVQKALPGAGLVAKRHKRGPHRRRRPRRPYRGCCCTLMAANISD